MMPMCSGGLTDCPNTAVFLGPHEDPALCQQHFDELKQRISRHENGQARAAIYRAFGEVSSLFMSQEVKGTEIVMPTEELDKIGSKLHGTIMDIYGGPK